MINLLAIKDMALKITTTITEVLLKEVDDFKIQEKTEDKVRIAFEVVEPIVLSALGSIMTIFTRLQYKRDEVLALTGMVFDQYNAMEQKFLEEERLKKQAQPSLGISAQQPIKNIDNTIPAINVKGTKDIN